jgi:phosphoglycolate phosphatase
MQVCIDCMNIMLKERALPLLNIRRYREIFTFPVRDYYIELGFDFKKEPFEVPAHRFIDLYREKMHLAPLHAEVPDILEHFHSHNIRQVILSAMEQEFLEETLEGKGIRKYFQIVSGIRNHLGEGKLEMAKELLEVLGNKPDEMFMVGDTIHDFEVASGSGIPCILIANGHQSYDRLKMLDCMVFEDMKSLKKLFRDYLEK